MSHEKVIKAWQECVQSIFVFGLNDPSGPEVVQYGHWNDDTCWLSSMGLFSWHVR